MEPERKYFKILEIVVVSAIAGLIEWFYFGFDHMDFSVPMPYEGDGLTNVVAIKKALTDGDLKFGWPYHQDSSMYEPWLNGLYFTFVRMAGLFTHDPVCILNVYIFLLLLLNVIVAYVVLNDIGIKKVLAFGIAITFGFYPYVQGRLMGHFALAAVECVPIVFWLCLRLYEDPEYFVPGRHFLKKKHNWYTILLCFMIANNGMMYYPYFSCFILGVTGVCIWARDKKFRSFIPAAAVILCISFWAMIDFIPTIIGMIRGFGNVATAGTGRAIGRTAVRAMLYGLDVKSMMLSPNGFGIKRLLEYYLKALKYENEKDIAYIGIVAIVGLVLLFVFLLLEEDGSVYFRRMKLLSKMTIAMILLAMLDGVGVFVCVIFPYISCFNRINPFVVFACSLAVGLTMERLTEKTASKGRIIWMTAVAVLFLYAFWEQRGSYYLYTSEAFQENREKMENDGEFFEKVDAVTSENAMVFQLPYMQSFENGSVNNISDYDHYKGYLYADDIRWSYGAKNGSANDIWYQETSQLSAGEMVDELRRQGFEGIYVNLDGYEETEGARLINDLQNENGDVGTVIMDGKNRKVYIGCK